MNMKRVESEGVGDNDGFFECDNASASTLTDVLCERQDQKMEIKTTFGGPCIYKQGILSDGTKTGKIEDVGQTKEQLEAELLASIKTGRDGVASFINRVVGT